MQTSTASTVRTAKWNDYVELCDICGERSSSHVTININSPKLNNSKSAVCSMCIITLMGALAT